jgi:hypothetical protein
MIRSYQDFLERRWNELGMPAKIHAAADVEDVQRPIQVPWMVQVAGELRHTTLHEGRRHPDVGLLFKATGNLFNANGLTISTDVICVRETNDAGEVTDPNAIATVDVIITSLRHAAHPGWLVTGRLAGADIARFRDPPVPAGTVPDETGKVDDTGKVDETGGGGIALPPVDNEALRALVQIAAQLQEIRTAQEADRAIQERIAAGIEGLRRDVGNAGKLLGALVAGGGLGNLADLIKPQKT